MAVTDVLIMSSKFRGSLLGALLGDCLGSPFEDRPLTKIMIHKFLDGLEASDYEGSVVEYTDDTAMTICIAESLIYQGKFDVRDMAKRFMKEYFKRPNLTYGIHIVDVFIKLRDNECEDPFGPAKEQFGGSGSYGNGGAMRITPIPLFFRNLSTASLADIARKSAEITHTHANGYNGAILQCLAIKKSFWLNPNEPIDTKEFLEDLIKEMDEIEEGDESMGREEDPKPFCNKLRWALELIERERNGGEEIRDVKDVLQKLGAGIAALDSVPTAIFCFLRAQQGPIPSIETENAFRRTVQYAISLGGDTDTIASMAGALCGAYLGYDSKVFSENLLKHCEGTKEMLDLADKLYAKSLPSRCMVKN